MPGVSNYLIVEPDSLQAILQTSRHHGLGALSKPAVRDWTDFPARSFGYSTFPGAAFAIQSVRIAKQNIASRRGLCNWIDLVPALETAHVGSTTPTWIVFEDTRYPATSSNRYKVLVHFPPLASAFAVSRDKSLRHENAGIEVPGNQRIGRPDLSMATICHFLIFVIMSLSA